MTPTASQLGTIRTSDGWSYRLTPEDVLWLARAAKYEGGSKPATLWTYAQRLALHRSMSMTDLVRGHSETVNPIWASVTGSGCQRVPSECTPDRLATRARAASATWDSLSTAPTVLAWAQAQVPNPVPRATDFAVDAPGNPVVTNFLARHPDAHVVLNSGNIYIAEGATSSWPADFVTIEYNGRVVGAGSSILMDVGIGLGVALATGVVAWMAAEEIAG